MNDAELVAEEDSYGKYVPSLVANIRGEKMQAYPAVVDRETGMILSRGKKGVKDSVSTRCPQKCHRLCNRSEYKREGPLRPFEVHNGPSSFTPSHYIKWLRPAHILTFRRPRSPSPCARYYPSPWVDNSSYGLPLRLIRAINPNLVKLKYSTRFFVAKYTLAKDEKAEWMARLNFLDEILLKKHFHKIRDQAWQQIQEISIGRWWFLRNRLRLNPYYSDIITFAREGASIADLACGLGQDCRWLRDDGATGQIWAIDICPKNWELGVQLFNDSPGPAQFLQVDLYQDQYNPCGLHALHDQVDIFLLNDYFSFFSETSMDVSLQTVAYATKKGSRIVGWVLGSDQTDLFKIFLDMGHGMIYNLDFFRDAGWGPFGKLARGSGQEWDLQAQLLEPEEFGFSAQEMGIVWPVWPLKIICFMATRVS